MFSTLESNWGHSAARRWITLASFAMQAVGVILLLAISLIWVERPPQVRWLVPIAVSAAAAPVKAPETGHPRSTATTVSDSHVSIAPQSFPLHAEETSGADSAPPAPDFPAMSARSHDLSGGGFGNGFGNSIAVVAPLRPAAGKPLLVSHWAEGNLLHRVQPNYPALARQARIQGTVELRAIISKSGAIENLVVVRGHPMLVKSAIEAVRQWRYRPYLLNGEPIEVETEVTVNFLLSGG
jgi:protein TonB